MNLTGRCSTMSHKAEASTGSLPCIISVSGLDDQILLLGLKQDLVIAGSRVVFVRRVADAVLIAQFVLNRAVDLLDRLLFGNFKKSGPGFPRNPFENLLSIRTLFLRIWSSSTTMPPHSS